MASNVGVHLETNDSLIILVRCACHKLVVNVFQYFIKKIKSTYNFCLFEKRAEKYREHPYNSDIMRTPMTRFLYKVPTSARMPFSQSGSRASMLSRCYRHEVTGATSQSFVTSSDDLFNVVALRV